MRLLSFLTAILTILRIRGMVLNWERILSELLHVRQELVRTRLRKVNDSSDATKSESGRPAGADDGLISAEIELPA